MISSIGSGLGLLALYSLDSADDKREFARYLSAGAAIAVVILIIASTKILPERPDYQDRGSKNPYKSFSDVFKNPHSLLLLTVFAIETFGAASIGLLVPYMIDYVIPKDLMPLEPSLFMISVLISYVIPQVAFTPLWIKLASLDDFPIPHLRLFRRLLFRSRLSDDDLGYLFCVWHQQRYCTRD